MTQFYLEKPNDEGTLVQVEVSEQEFRDVYGTFVIMNLTPEMSGWRIRALRDKIHAPAGTSVFVYGLDGTPFQQTVPIQMYYSTAPERPGSAPPNGLPPGVTERGDVGLTDIDGHCGWSWGDAYYWPNHDDPAKRRGPYCYWVADGENSESIDGVGMIGLTEHRRYDIELIWTEGGVVPPDPPQAPDWVFVNASGVIADDPETALGELFGGDVEQDSGPAFKVSMIRESRQAGTMIYSLVKVSMDGEPIAGIPVAVQHSLDGSLSEYYTTDGRGQVSIPWPRSERYSLFDESPYSIGIEDGSTVYRVGRVLLQGEPDRCLDIDFVWLDDGGEPPSDLEGRVSELEARMDALEAAFHANTIVCEEMMNEINIHLSEIVRLLEQWGEE